jgi:hypothetical protein
MARPKSSEGSDCFIVPQKDMIKCETIELLLKLSYLLTLCRHAEAVAV